MPESISCVPRHLDQFLQHASELENDIIKPEHIKCQPFQFNTLNYEFFNGQCKENVPCQTRSQRAIKPPYLDQPVTCQDQFAAHSGAERSIPSVTQAVVAQTTLGPTGEGHPEEVAHSIRGIMGETNTTSVHAAAAPHSQCMSQREDFQSLRVQSNPGGFPVTRSPDLEVNHPDQVTSSVRST